MEVGAKISISKGETTNLKKITDGSPQYLLPSKFYSAWCDDDFHVLFQLIYIFEYANN